MEKLILEQAVTIEYRLQGHRSRHRIGRVAGRLTGEIDTWGKHTLQPDGSRVPLYLFADEILSCVAANSEPAQWGGLGGEPN